MVYKTEIVKHNNTKTAEPELEPPALLVVSYGFNIGPAALVLLFPE